MISRLLTTAAHGQGDDLGFAPLTTVLGLGLLVIPMLLLVLTLPTWEERTVDARDIAADAARVLVSADSWTAGTAAADQTVAQEAANDGLGPNAVSVAYSGSLTPGTTVTATVMVTVPGGAIPGVGTFSEWHYKASSTQLVDLYRSEGS